MKAWTDYWQSNDGIVLLRRSGTKTGVTSRLMSTGTNGQWVEDNGGLFLNVHDSNASRLTVAEAAQIAARLHGSLLDDGGTIKIGRNGP